MVHFGFSIAASTHVGNMLGAGKLSRARTTSYVTLGLVFAISSILAVFILLLRHDIGAAFGSDADLIALVERLSPLVAAYVLLDALGPGALNSILKAMGLVCVPAALNFVAFYVLGLPAGMWLTFGAPKWGVYGLWMGSVVGITRSVGSLSCVRVMAGGERTLWLGEY